MTDTWTDAKLPCDIPLPPATIIRAGCKLSTLIEALKVRGMAVPLSASPKGDDLEPVADDLVERLREGPIRTGDTEDGEYELFDIEEAMQTMLDAASALQYLKAERDALRGTLDAVRKRTKNARGAIESDQVVDKDVHGSLTWVLDTIDAALSQGGK
jgi:hypothetical protein